MSASPKLQTRQYFKQAACQLIAALVSPNLMDTHALHEAPATGSPSVDATSSATSAPDTSNSEAHIMPGMSKYDFVKIRVHLGSHYYVLSRFLVSRMLQV